MPLNVKKMTNDYRDRCGCKVCTFKNCHQNSLNKYQLSTIKRLELDVIDKTRVAAYRNIVYKNKAHLHSKPRNALCCIQCSNVDNFSVPYLKYIL